MVRHSRVTVERGDGNQVGGGRLMGSTGRPGGARSGGAGARGWKSARRGHLAARRTAALVVLAACAASAPHARAGPAPALPSSSAAAPAGGEDPIGAARDLAKAGRRPEAIRLLETRLEKAPG